MKLNIDLKKKEEKLAVKPSDFSYPTLYLSGEDPLDFPDSGQMTIRYRVRNRGKTSNNGDTRYSTDLDVMEIVSATGEEEKPQNSKQETIEALRELRSRIKKEKEGELEEKGVEEGD